MAASIWIANILVFALWYGGWTPAARTAASVARAIGSARSKLLMMLQSILSQTIFVVLAARAITIP